MISNKGERGFLTLRSSKGKKLLGTETQIQTGEAQRAVTAAIVIVGIYSGRRLRCAHRATSDHVLGDGAPDACAILLTSVTDTTNKK